MEECTVSAAWWLPSLSSPQPATPCLSAEWCSFASKLHSAFKAKCRSDEPGEKPVCSRSQSALPSLVALDWIGESNLLSTGTIAGHVHRSRLTAFLWDEYSCFIF